MIIALVVIAMVTLIYVISLTWTIIGFIGQQRIPVNVSPKNLKLSILIPVRNEQENILNCLTSLEKQNYPKEDFEVIIIDDHSTDQTLQVVKRYASNSSLDLKWFSLDNTETKKEALKFGVQQAQYGIILTTDGDCYPSSTWLNSMVADFGHSDMLLGPVMFSSTKGFLHNFQILDLCTLQALGFGSAYFQRAVLNNAANLMYVKDGYQSVGGYDSLSTVSGDDVFLLEKFKAAGKFVSAALRKECIVETDAENSLSAFINQRVRWASKAKYYKSNLLRFFSLLGVLQNVIALFIYVALPLVEKYHTSLIILLLTKWLIDFILLFLVTAFFGKKKALLYFIPAQLLYPIYIFVVGLSSVMVKYNWKARTYNG